MFDGRVFALLLIGIASLYVCVMICQSVLYEQEEVDSEYESQYQYQTESHDFKLYQSLDTEN